MLKELFESHFYSDKLFPRKAGITLLIDEQTYEGDFAVLDRKACQDCHNVCSPTADEREQLKIHAVSAVNVISIDQVFSFVSEDIGETCDYMIEGDKTTVLLEMTCSTSDYVKDKRSKARRQLRNTLFLLFTSPIVRNHIEAHTARYAVFSWRETFDMVARNKAEKNIIDMTLMADSVYSPNNEQRFDFGFKLKEIRYPDTLVV